MVSCYSSLNCLRWYRYIPTNSYIIGRSTKCLEKGCAPPIPPSKNACFIFNSRFKTAQPFYWKPNQISSVSVKWYQTPDSQLPPKLSQASSNEHIVFLTVHPGRYFQEPCHLYKDTMPSIRNSEIILKGQWDRVSISALFHTDNVIKYNSLQSYKTKEWKYLSETLCTVRKHICMRTNVAPTNTHAQVDKSNIHTI